MRQKLLADLPEPTPERIKELRTAAGLSQRAAGGIVGLKGTVSWSEYERGAHKISAPCWALFLLAVGMHPTMRVAVRRSSHPD